MKIKLIAFDLDGTVLRNDKTISQRTKEALARAADQGIYVVPATGRTYEGIPEEIRNLSFLRYVIGINGALIYDIQEKRVLHRAEMGEEETIRMLTYMESLPAAVTCYQNGKGWISARVMDEVEAYAPCPEQIPYMKRILTPVENMQETISRHGATTQKLQVFFKEVGLREQYLQEMQEKFPDYSVSYSLSNNIEVNALEANKGSALKFLCEYLQIDPMESMAFGDGTNDTAMIRQAGTGVAMGNAEQEVREAADCVTLSNGEDGVAVMLEKLLAEMEQ